MHLNNRFVIFLALSLSTQCLGSVLPEIFLAEIAHAFLPKVEDGCSIAINGGLPKHQPLILTTDLPPSLALPNGNGSLVVPKDGMLRLACSGGNNNLSVAESPEAVVTCVSGMTFRVTTPGGSEEDVEFSKLTCSEYPYSTARYRQEQDPDCQPPFSPTEIGFILPSDGHFLRVIDGCFDNRSLNAIYTHFDMPYVISSYESGFPRPGFMQGYFYGNLSVNQIYTRNKQREVISKILGSEELGHKYIQDSGDYYLARGHFSAKADFIYGAVQRATFYFVNAAPQWQSFNGANWANLEIHLRDFAANSKLNLSVWTGSYGVTTLPDVNGVEQKISIYLDENGNDQIDVPALYWKVALEPSTRRAVGFVGVNNPYLNPVPESLILCKSVCDKLDWLPWDASNIDQGFSYCCEVDELRKTITTIPKFETSGLLFRCSKMKFRSASIFYDLFPPLVLAIFYLGFLKNYASASTKQLLVQNGENLKKGCSVAVNGGLSEYAPLILLASNPAATALPDAKGNLRVPAGGKLRLACSGSSNVLSFAETAETVVTCSSGTAFQVMTPAGVAMEVEFRNLTCSQYPFSTARYRKDLDQDCRPPNSPLEIGFVLPADNQFLRIIDGCFDNRSLNAIYTHFEMPHVVSAYQRGVPRRKYTKGKFYGSLPVNALYSRDRQRETISKILGSNQLGLRYVPEEGDNFLARGHLSAKGDFIYGSHQRATFFFVNAAPQWHAFNAGNWASLEVSLRQFASSSRTDLSVWTGIYGVSTLPDDDGRDSRIALQLDENGNGQIEVPAVYWKIALDRESGRAAAFVGVNNPYLTTVPESLILCKDVCEKIGWLKWRGSSIREGYSYCCEVDELRKVVKSIPAMETTGLLVAYAMHLICTMCYIFLINLHATTLANNESLGDSSVLSNGDSGCRLNFEDDLPTPLPLMLTIEDNPRFVLPDLNGVIRIPKGGGMRMVCTGNMNFLPNIEFQDANIVCISGTKFTVPTPGGYKEMELSLLNCANSTESTARYSASEDSDCHSPLLSVEVGFGLPKDDKFVLLYKGCFDSRKFNVIYSMSALSRTIGWRKGGFPFNGSLCAGGFYENMDLEELYSPRAQREVVSKLLGSSELGGKYINETAGRFLSPGLLTTDGDFDYSSQKSGTHQYVNSVPQWQYADSKNWNDLDESLREFAANNGIQLLVWTGAYGVMTLPDSNGTQRGLSLALDESGHGLIDVPALLWRIAYEPKTGSAVAFAGVNNPYLTEIPESLILCNSICDKLKWLGWSPEVIDGGFCYCCEVDEIRQNVESMPDVEVKGILGRSTSSVTVKASDALLVIILIFSAFISATI
ncbi:uncharacterized protein LOC124155167 [Ischnura elegans]|uniref:uncharacterized protein LOC124155167 n=1 Tax=Ischnura elegans TaxID=197161 RepID=UPI001ED8A341|nr:uncharacterized protein LOC124155167 [Ischnura elegans]